MFRAALAFAVPMMIQNGITNAVGLVDNVMVGSQGTEAMTAVSIASQLLFVFNLAVFGGLSGPGIFGSQFYGAENMEGVRHCTRLKIWIGLILLAVGVSVFLGAGDILLGLYLQGESAEIDPELTLALGLDYLHIMMFSILPFVITQIYASTLRETKDSVKPMVAGICSVVVDIVLNYCLIYGHFGFPALGVRGAAIATVAARVAEMLVIVLWTHAQKAKHLFLDGLYRTLRIPRDLTERMVRKSLPIFLNEFLWAGGVAMLTQIYSHRGLDVVAGLNISNALCNLLNVVFIAMGHAVGILTGQMLGAQEYEKAQRSAFPLMWFSGGLCVSLSVILIALSGVFPMVYDTTDEVRLLGQRVIIITACFFPVQGFLNSLYFTLRSGGKTLVTFLFDSCFSWVVSVPVAAALCWGTGLPFLGIYIVIQALDIVKILIGAVMIKKGIWLSNIVA